MKLSGEEFRPFLEHTAEQVSESALCLDTEGHILWANSAAARTLESPIEQLLEKTIFQVASEMNPALWRELWREIRARGSFQFEFHLAVGSRTVRVEMGIHHLRPAERELACVFFRDIEARQKLQQLQQEFVSTASHELRTPMTVIREGVAQVLEGLRGDINESQKRALSMVLGSVDRLGRIMDELLDMSKMEAGKLTLKYERLDISSLVQEGVAAFEPRAVERGLLLQVCVPPKPVWVYADRDRVNQVLANLLSNAFKFTEKGRITASISEKSDHMECRITDTGVGMKAEDLEKIFFKFEQLNQVAFTGERGTGLGLSITRGLVDLHGGAIWAESAGVGQGTQFVFTLPRLSSEAFFKSQVDPLLRELAHRGGSLTTVVFHLESGDAAAFESIIRQCMGRMTDLVVRDGSTVYLAISGMIKREGQRVVERILTAFVPHRVSARLEGYPENSTEAG